MGLYSSQDAFLDPGTLRNPFVSPGGSEVTDPNPIPGIIETISSVAARLRKRNHMVPIKVGDKISIFPIMVIL